MVTAPARKPWRNWGRNQSCQPVAIESPGSEEQLVATVGAARERGQHVKVVGAGHSFTDIACTDGRMLRLDTYNRVLGAGREARTISVQSGITIVRLGEKAARMRQRLEGMCVNTMVLTRPKRLPSRAATG